MFITFMVDITFMVFITFMGDTASSILTVDQNFLTQPIRKGRVINDKCLSSPQLHIG